MMAISAMTNASSSGSPCAAAQDQQHVQRGEAHAPDSGMWNSRFSAMAEPITSARSQAAMAISAQTHRMNDTGRRIVVAAGLGQVAAGDDAELERQRLQQDGHEVGEQDDRKQRVAEARAAGQVGGPVARVHVADRDQVAGPGEGEQLAPETRATSGRRCCDGPPAGWDGQPRAASLGLGWFRGLEMTGNSGGDNISVSIHRKVNYG